MKKFKFLSLVSLLAVAHSTSAMEKTSYTTAEADGKFATQTALTDLTNKVSATTEELRKAQAELANKGYVTTGDLDRKEFASKRDLSSYAKTSDLQHYATPAQVEAKLAGYTHLNELNRVSETLATKNELKSAVDAVQAKLDTYPTRAEIQTNCYTRTQVDGLLSALTNKIVAREGVQQTLNKLTTNTKKAVSQLQWQKLVDRTAVAVPAALTLLAVKKLNTKKARSLALVVGLVATGASFKYQPLQSGAVKNRLGTWIPVVALETQLAENKKASLDRDVVEFCPTEKAALLKASAELEEYLKKNPLSAALKAEFTNANHTGLLDYINALAGDSTDPETSADPEFAGE